MAYIVLASIALGCYVLMILVQRRCVLCLPVTHPHIAAEPTPRAGWRSYIPLALLLTVMMLAGLNYRAMSHALPPYLGSDTSSHVAWLKGGLEVFLVLLIGGCIGQYLGGWAIDRHGKRVYFVFITVLASAALLMGFLQGSSAAVLVAGLLAVGMFAQQPIENTILAQWTSKRRRSLSYGTKCLLTFGLGALGGPLAGWIRDTTGSPAPVFFVIPGFGVLMLLLVFLALRLAARPAPIPPVAD